MKRKNKPGFARGYLVKFVLVNIAITTLLSILAAYIFPSDALTLPIKILLSALFSLASTWHLLFVPDVDESMKTNVIIGWFFYGLIFLGFASWHLIDRFIYGHEPEGSGLLAGVVIVFGVIGAIAHTSIAFVVTEAFKK